MTYEREFVTDNLSIKVLARSSSRSSGDLVDWLALREVSEGNHADQSLLLRLCSASMPERRQRLITKRLARHECSWPSVHAGGAEDHDHHCPALTGGAFSIFWRPT